MTGQEHAGTAPGPEAGSALPKDPAAEEATPADATAPRQTQFAGRASNLLLVLGGLGVGVAALVVLPSSAPLAPRVVAGVLLTATGTAMLLLSFALDRGRPWAPATAAAALWIVLVLSVIRAVAQVAHGGLSIPLDSVAAAWALSGSGRPAIGLAGRPAASVLLLGLVLLGGVGEPVAGMLFTPGVSPFAVAKTALLPGIFAACSGEPGAMPSRIHVVGSWTWTSTDLLPSGTDGVGIGWNASGADIRYAVDRSEPSGTDGYLWRGSGGAAGSAVGRELEASGMGLTWGVHVDGGGLRDGAVSLDLVPVEPDAAARPQHGILTIRIVYAHLDRWLVTAETACSW